MINEKDWEKILEKLDNDDLDQLARLIPKFKKKTQGREEFMDVLKRWKEKYPQAKYFYTGGASKGAYECSGDLMEHDWMDDNNLDDAYNQRGYTRNDPFMAKFKSFEEFNESLLNTYLKESDEVFNQFEDELNASLHAPEHEDVEAKDFSCGDTSFEFIDIETGDTYEVMACTW